MQFPHLNKLLLLLILHVCAGCEQIYPPTIANGFDVPLVIETVFEGGEKEVITIPAKNQRVIAGRAVSATDSGYTITKWEGSLLTPPTVVKELTVSLATGEMLYGYPGIARDVMVALNAGGLRGEVFWLFTARGIFPIPEEMQKDWQARVPEIEKTQLPYVRGQRSSEP